MFPIDSGSNLKTFNEMKLPEALAHTLQHMQYSEPTPIQAQAIPLALQGRDILGSAQTGTGKTAAFGIPLVARLLLDPKSSALVMTPTRELAAQVMTQLNAMLGKRTKIKSALLIGGQAMPKQLTQLKNRPRVIVGTPGRINDHLKRRSLKLNHTDFLVLDETDRMLDMGFTSQIESVLKHMAAKRQTLLFSATLPKNIVRIAEKYLNDPARVSVNSTSSPADNIKQEIIKVDQGNKYPVLLAQLEKRKGSIIVFMKTKFGSEKMAKRLSKDGHSADAIHGDLRQNKRDRVIAAFRAEKFRILVATDVAARGLDIPHIEHVINHDLPQVAEDYIHRIGRTARAGAEGEALNLVTPADKNIWREIARLLGPDADFSETQIPGKTQTPNKKPRHKDSGRGEAKGKGKFKSRGNAKTKGKGERKDEAAPSKKPSFKKKKRKPRTAKKKIRKSAA